MRRAVLLLAVAGTLAACSAEDEPATVWLYHMERQVHGPAPTGRLTCKPPQERCPFVHGPPGEVLRYGVRGEPAVGGTDVLGSSARAEEATIVLELSPEGAQRFHAFTRSLAAEGRARGRMQHFVVAVDGEIVTFGGIDFEATPDGLTGETGIQLALPSPEEAERVATRIRGGRG